MGPMVQCTNNTDCGGKGSPSGAAAAVLYQSLQIERGLNSRRHLSPPKSPLFAFKPTRPSSISPLRSRQSIAIPFTHTIHNNVRYSSRPTTRRTKSVAQRSSPWFLCSCVPKHRRLHQHDGMDLWHPRKKGYTVGRWVVQNRDELYRRLPQQTTAVQI